MYSKQSAAVIREQFWTSFGQYLAPIPSAEGNKINWINYKTGIRFIHFKMEVDDTAYIAIELSHPDKALQEIFFNHFKGFRSDLESISGEEWAWEKLVPVNGKTISRIFQTLPAIDIRRQSDWPQTISFLKTRIISLDHFWAGHKDIFEMLG